MKDKDASQNTVILNKFESDGFLDFYYTSDLDEVMKVLNRLIIK